MKDAVPARIKLVDAARALRQGDAGASYKVLNVRAARAVIGGSDQLVTLVVVAHAQAGQVGHVGLLDESHFANRVIVFIEHFKGVCFRVDLDTPAV